MKLITIIMMLFIIMSIVIGTELSVKIQSEAGTITEMNINIPYILSNDNRTLDDLCFEYAIMFLDGDYSRVHYTDGYCYGDLE